MSEKVKRTRLDLSLVARGYFQSRELAQRAIMAGEVRVGDAIVDKASAKVTADAPIFIREAPAFVGRGGVKMEGALRHFNLDPAGFTALDIGASTGGFTDCLLQHGAKKVYAIQAEDGIRDVAV